MSVPFDILKQAKDTYQKAFNEESIAQGHYLTGDLQRSQTAEFTETKDSSTVALLMPGYALPLNSGVPAKNVPFREGSGAKSSKYIDALTLYWQLRGLPSDEARNAAFATAKKHKKEGMPTNASYLSRDQGKERGLLTFQFRK